MPFFKSTPLPSAALGLVREVYPLRCDADDMLAAILGEDADMSCMREVAAPEKWTKENSIAYVMAALVIVMAGGEDGYAMAAEYCELPLQHWGLLELSEKNHPPKFIDYTNPSHIAVITRRAALSHHILRNDELVDVVRNFFDLI
jgi:hypothetical protein